MKSGLHPQRRVQAVGLLRRSLGFDPRLMARPVTAETAIVAAVDVDAHHVVAIGQLLVEHAAITGRDTWADCVAGGVTTGFGCALLLPHPVQKGDGAHRYGGEPGALRMAMKSPFRSYLARWQDV